MITEDDKTIELSRKYEYHLNKVKDIGKMLGLYGGAAQKARQDKQCKECHSHSPLIFNKDKVHYLDGNRSNQSNGNTAIVCPNCSAHILQNHYTPEDVFRLKLRGLNNAKIGELLNLSRERVRQLIKKHLDMKNSLNDKSLPPIDQLIQEAQNEEARLKSMGKINRITDRRTLRKRIQAELDKNS